MPGDVTFFKTQNDFRTWLEKHHNSKEVLWIGLYKVSSGKQSIRWSEAVEEALCFGWIDGLRKSIDDERYKIRFTPRKPDSHWSQKNIDTSEQLIEEDRMQPAGLEAYRQRDENNTAQASYEQDEVSLKKEYEDKIRSSPKAWKFFRELAPGYTRTSIHWVMSAKKEETRQRRLRVLIESCENGQKVPPLRRG
ncbi:YdeI family protein [Halalkalibaculum sp. DA384]|uniref:YdeI/OmpD-associated family protein n=1 Tax=Halalkalibaculum sp. DA384 TaxID=3373606 RepID=UPI003754B15B